ncbi:hypothetical protein KBK19_03985 [Microvirga sp. STR05]|uniref:Uncharacterized protein n=1 Tax=Hymenobacter duratus TaxID=2771356 RepID=A0ABR8JFL4_9BACT|nr:hypothetical protein [Hymenobacter duratus]MBD2714190.1 hypothetical protein [Hymenobacter duratus]MBR7949092.1 hypothetical protein [Microvirga sp. STR05]
MSSPDISCSLHHRPDLGLLVARWPSDAPVHRLQTDFEALLRAALGSHTGRWLLDVRRREALQPDFAHWTVHDFFPRAATALAPQPLRIAALCSPARLTVYDSSAEQQAILQEGTAPDQHYRLRLFLDEGAAIQWLSA